ncbi:aspartate carbamoyltransferase regulatory subunit [Candidatus Kapaibacterium sp.]
MVTELKVSAIENGTVIDHIPSKNVFQVIKILDLENFDNQILFGTNLESKKYGTKGIIKVRNKYFADDDINRISLVAPKATLIVIKDFQVVEKRRVEVPDTIDGIVRCFNPNCITNVENVATKFKVVSKDEVILQCHYCEKNTVKKNISFK